MQVTVGLVIAMSDKTKPSDNTKAIVKTYDANGIDFGDEVTLDATTTQTTLELATGHRIEVKEFVAPPVYDSDQSASVPGEVPPVVKVEEATPPPFQGGEATTPTGVM